MRKRQRNEPVRATNSSFIIVASSPCNIMYDTAAILNPNQFRKVIGPKPKCQRYVPHLSYVVIYVEMDHSASRRQTTPRIHGAHAAKPRRTRRETTAHTPPNHGAHAAKSRRTRRQTTAHTPPNHGAHAAKPHRHFFGNRHDKENCLLS
jgi:hypothetical protein